MRDVIVEAAHAGVDVIQIRERHLDDRALLDLARRALDATRGAALRIVINDRFDIALAAKASGVHLRGDSPAAGRIRTIAPSGFFIGRSVHDVMEASDVAGAGGCDYLLFGTVFQSASKAHGHATAGAAALRQVCASVRIPVLAIGGITTDNVREVVAAGASGIAAISLFDGGAPIASTVALLRRRFDT